MMGADGFIQAYNAQLAVDDAHQVIVACGVTDQPADAANFAPMLQRVRANVGAAPEHATGDSGYWNPQVETRARALGTEAWVATDPVRHGDSGPASCIGDPPDELDPRERMRWRLDTLRGSSAVRASKGRGRARQRSDQARAAVPALLHANGSFPDLRGYLFEELMALSSQVIDSPVILENPSSAGRASELLARWTRKLHAYREARMFPHDEGGGEAGTLIVTRDDEHGEIDTQAVAELIRDVFTA